MKKKLSIILITLVLVATMVLTASCVKNEERDLTRATAEITFAGRASQVDKLELNSTVYNFVYRYYYYYQQGYITASDYQKYILDKIDERFEKANEELAESEAYTLKCINELYWLVMANGTEAEKAAADAAKTVDKAYNVADRIAEIESVLPKKDLIAARKSYNDEMKEAFDGYREEYETDIANAAPQKSTDNVTAVHIVSAPWKTTYEKGETLLENGLKVQVVYNEDEEHPVDLDRADYTVTGFSSDEVKDDVEVTVEFGNKTDKFTVNIIAAKPSRPALPTEEEEDGDEDIPALFEDDLAQRKKDAKNDKEELNALVEAERSLLKQMKANYRDYSYYYLSALKKQVVTAYEEIVGNAAEELATAESDGEYARRFAEQSEDLRLDPSSYSDVVDGTGIKSQIVRKDDGTFYVWNLLLKITDDLEEKYTKLEKKYTATDTAELERYHKELVNQTLLYVSNPDYDKDATCEEEECTCTACENYTGENPGPCTDPDCTCVKCPNKRYISKDSDLAVKKGLNISDDDTINVEVARDAVLADLALSAVTADSTDAERAAMLEKFKTWVYMLNDDEGFFTTLSDGKLGYSLTKEGTSSYVENFTALSRALAKWDEAGTDEDVAEERLTWHVVGEGVGSYGWCYTSYGIHIVMLSAYALPASSAQIGDTELYSVPMNAVTDYANYDAETEEGTLKKLILDELIKEKKTALVDDFQQNFYLKEMKEGATFTYHDIYDDLADQYKA